jgi:hypothetical protein
VGQRLQRGRCAYIEAVLVAERVIRLHHSAARLLQREMNLTVGEKAGSQVFPW